MLTETPTPQRLYLMQVGVLEPPVLPIPCYLIQMSDGTNVLIDSGLPPTTPDRFTITRYADVIEQLGSIGVAPDDVGVMICTHFDFDHCGMMDRFTRATYVVQRKHYEDALTNPRYSYARPQWDQPIERFRFVDGDKTLLPNLELLETSGHVPGHQSVLVRLPQAGAVLLAIDAVPHRISFSMKRKAMPTDDAPALYASTQKLIDLAERESALVIFGHDPAQWERLKKLPAFYA